MARTIASRLITASLLALIAACSADTGSATTATRTTREASGQTDTAAGPAASGSPGPAAAWPTYHGDNLRTGRSGAAPLKPPLRRAWSRQLDGAVYAQPIVVGRMVIVATENNTVYALRPRTGHVVWRHHLGTPVPLSALPCGNIDPLGITGTPAYDRATATVFVVTETTDAHHMLRALNVRTGHERWHRSLDVLPNRDRHAEQQRPGLLVAHHRVYTAFGGLAGDCGNYVGYVTAVPTDGNGSTLHYAVPTSREAGIWAPPGPVQDKTLGDIYVAVGNGAQIDGAYDGSDSVIQLGPKLHKKAYFAPSTWREDNQADLDLGSSAPVFNSATNQFVIAGKRGTVYLLGDLNGIGSQRATLSGCSAYGGGATTAQFVVLPCSDGIRMLSLGASTMHWVWQVSGVSGSPVIARHKVYALDTETGELVELSLRTGHVLARYDVGQVSRFATPVPVGKRVYVGTMGGVVAVHGSA